MTYKVGNRYAGLSRHADRADLERRTPMNQTTADSTFGGFETVDLAAIARGLSRSPIADLVPVGVTRRWAYVIETDRYEAIVIAWPSGTGLAMHDHGGSAAA